MPNVISALTARTQFGQIMKRATENDERFMVDRRGQPQVIIMSVNDYIKTIAPPPKVLQEIWADSKRKGANKLTMRQINAEIAAYRREKRKNRAIARSAK
ncbi:MAG: prevent-host-death family protein [Blastocatellia bacterium AA13]|nr:MAG: prevent-host-death family protein [Blastocatellia bacterium AA13]